MAKLKKPRYVLAVKDLIKSFTFYKTVLGFDGYILEGGGWAFLNLDNCHIMLGECPDDREAFETKNHSYFAYIEVENIDDLFQEIVDQGGEILHPPADKDWGMREFALRTIDGHRIMFGQETEI